MPMTAPTTVTAAADALDLPPFCMLFPLPPDCLPMESDMTGSPGQSGVRHQGPAGGDAFYPPA